MEAWGSYACRAGLVHQALPLGQSESLPPLFSDYMDLPTHVVDPLLVQA